MFLLLPTLVFFSYYLGVALCFADWGCSPLVGVLCSCGFGVGL